MRASEHDRLGFLLLAGSEEVWSGIDLLAGRELIYVADVRRRQGGSWLVERVDFTGSELRRVESLEFSQPRTPPTSPAIAPAPATVTTRCRRRVTSSIGRPDRSEDIRRAGDEVQPRRGRRT